MEADLIDVKGAVATPRWRALASWEPFPDVHVALAELDASVGLASAWPARVQLAAMRSLVRQVATDLARTWCGESLRVSSPGQAPRFEPEGEWSLSLAHAWPVVACAIARDALVGVDLEVMDHERDLAAQAQIAFRVGESGGGASADLRCWTVKEAVLKAGRRGLTADPQRVGTDKQDHLVAVPPGWGRPQDWRVSTSWWQQRVAVAVASLPASLSPVGGQGMLD